MPWNLPTSVFFLRSPSPLKGPAPRPLQTAATCSLPSASSVNGKGNTRTPPMNFRRQCHRHPMNRRRSSKVTLKMDSFSVGIMKDSDGHNNIIQRRFVHEAQGCSPVLHGWVVPEAQSRRSFLPGRHFKRPRSGLSFPKKVTQLRCQSESPGPLLQVFEIKHLP
jgi:hypothetical protein